MTTGYSKFSGRRKTASGDFDGELQVGSARASGLEIVASPIAQLRKIDRKAHGVLGQNFLGRSAYLIDYARKKLWLGEDAKQRADELPFVLSAQQMQRTDRFAGHASGWESFLASHLG